MFGRRKVKISKTALSVALSAITLVSAFSGCSGKKKASIEAWGAYNTLKVIRQTDKNDEYEKLPAKLSAEMTKNEYEGAQLILTSDKRVSYELIKSDLVSSDGKKFPAENISVYHQKYIEISKNNSGNKAYESGSFVPDMLLPMEKAVEYGENFIEANSNQGVTVEFCSTGVEAGEYTGEFTLKTGDEERKVPVSVTVWDIEYEGRRSYKSSFLIYRRELLSSEYDTTDETVNAYVDFLLKYKVNSYVIKDAASNTLEEFVREAKRLYPDDNYSSIVIPYDFPLSYTAYNGSALSSGARKVVDYLLALAELSAGEDDYLSLAYFYPSTYDESDINGTEKYSELFLKKGGEYDKTLQAAAEAIDSDARFSGLSEEKRKELKDKILAVPAVFTNVHFVDDWVGSLFAAFCPYFSLFGDTATLQRYRDAAENNSYGELWGYTCMEPTYPYGTFHIDDSALGMRLTGFMSKAMGVNGYLYYAVNMATQFRLSPEVYTDVYDNPLRYEDVPGDGYLLYPGKYYGSKEPFASVRLVSFRDAMDDYDMLCVYEREVEKYAEKNGLTIDFNEFVNDLYADLFDGAVYYRNDSYVYEARRELARRILSLKNDGKLIESEGEKTFFGEKEVSVAEGSAFTAKDGVIEATIKAVYRDNGTYIGSKTRTFRPSVTFGSEILKNAKSFSFEYENTGDTVIEATVELELANGGIYSLITNYCPINGTRKVSVALSERLLSSLGVNAADISAIRISFDNVSYGKNGEVSLMADRKLAIKNFCVTGGREA